MPFTMQSNEELLCTAANLCAKQVPVFLQEHSFEAETLADTYLGPRKCSLRNIVATSKSESATRNLNGARESRRAWRVAESREMFLQEHWLIRPTVSDNLH